MGDTASPKLAKSSRKPQFMDRKCPWLAAALLLVSATACGTAGGAGDGEVSATECRQWYADLAQLHGENGNPGGSATPLVDRWEVLDAEADELAQAAGSDDCPGRYDDLRAEWGGLESLQYALAPFDMPRQLEMAEWGRQHWVEYHEEMGAPTRLPDGVGAAFRVLRREAPLATDDLAAAYAGVADVDVTDAGARDALVADVEQAAGESTAYARCQAALRVIGNAELGEE